MAIRTTTQAGLASATSTWGGNPVPVEGDSVVIVHTVTQDIANATWGDDTATAIQINSGGTLYASRSTNNKLTAKGQVIVASGGNFDYGTIADPIPTGVTAELVLNYSTTLANVKYGMTVNTGNPGAKFSVVGAARNVYTTLAADVAASDISLTVTDATGWLVGDVIYIGSSNTYGEAESKTIAGIVGNVITVAALSYAHKAGVPIVDSGGNVKLYAYNATYKYYIGLLCSNTSHAVDSFQIKYADFKDLSTNSTNTYYGISLAGNSSQPKVVKEISNTSFSASNAGLDFSQWGQDKPMDRLAFGGVASSINTRSGSIVNLTNFCFVNSSTAIQSSYSQGAALLKLSGGIFNGCSYALSFGPAMGAVIDDCIFDANNVVGTGSQAGLIQINRAKINMGVGTPTTISVFTGQTNSAINWQLNDCELKAGSFTNMHTNLSLALSSHKLVWSNKNLDPLQQEIYTSSAILYRDNAFYRTSAPSVRIEPTSATVPFTFSINVFAPTNKPVVVSGYIQKNAAYGSANLPFVTLSGLGITPNTFTIADINDEWQQWVVQGTQVSGTDGMLTVTFTFQSAGAGAKVWIDDVVAPVATSVNVGEFGYWANGLPVQAVLANFVSAADVWNIQEDQLTLAGSAGKSLFSKLKTILGEVL